MVCHCVGLYQSINRSLVRSVWHQASEYSSAHPCKIACILIWSEQVAKIMISTDAMPFLRCEHTLKRLFAMKRMMLLSHNIRGTYCVFCKSCHSVVVCSCETYRLVWMAGNTKRARSYILFRIIGSVMRGAVVYQALSFGFLSSSVQHSGRLLVVYNRFLISVDLHSVQDMSIP